MLAPGRELIYSVLYGVGCRRASAQGCLEGARAGRSSSTVAAAPGAFGPGSCSPWSSRPAPPLTRQFTRVSRIELNECGMPQSCVWFYAQVGSKPACCDPGLSAGLSDGCGSQLAAGTVASRQ